MGLPKVCKKAIIRKALHNHINQKTAGQFILNCLVVFSLFRGFESVGFFAYLWRCFMTRLQKSEIVRLRRCGVGYTKIAEALGVSENTVKSHCRRNNLGRDFSKKIVSDCCQQCGKPLGKSRQKSRRFCSDSCRMTWWKAHPESLNRKAVYHFTCAHCGKPFDSYGNVNRRYCSRICFGAARRISHA